MRITPSPSPPLPISFSGEIIQKRAKELEKQAMIEKQVNALRSQRKNFLMSKTFSLLKSVLSSSKFPPNGGSDGNNATFLENLITKAKDELIASKQVSIPRELKDIEAEVKSEPMAQI